LAGESVAIILTVLCKVISGMAHKFCAFTRFTLHNELLCIRWSYLTTPVEYYAQ
jgi:hypothetical protein